MSLGDPRADPLAALPDLDEPDGRLTRAELRADVRAAWRTVAILVVAGLPLGMLWAVLAPAVRVVVLPDGDVGVLPGDNDHAFDALAVFVLLTVVFGVVAGAVSWRRRRRRGPVLLAATALGTLVGAWLAGRVGVGWGLLVGAGTPTPVTVDPALASGGTVAGPPLPAVLTALPPAPGPWWIALAAGLAATLTYVFAAIVNGHEDMDRDEVPGPL